MIRRGTNAGFRCTDRALSDGKCLRPSGGRARPAPERRSDRGETRIIFFSAGTGHADFAALGFFVARLRAAGLPDVVRRSGLGSVKVVGGGEIAGIWIPGDLPRRGWNLAGIRLTRSRFQGAWYRSEQASCSPVRARCGSQHRRVRDSELH